IAPFEFSLITVETEDETVLCAAQNIFEQIHQAGMDVLWDDREERAGIKFKDADLMGLPYRIVVSLRTLKDGECEFKLRKGGPAQRWKLSEIADRLRELKVRNV
ncbi:MAG: His/Gly/Thr/Pro-type tRNA ligase C-terminal domain-containing protein, partial [Elusimicrobia bacterium]|nr:His/Gly/Thr/Pro-type tRNA ligase C-terminal domain-containing protein [Elusimicrobiota bacterium]